jgi:GT2 family glycosyltransferase
MVEQAMDRVAHIPAVLVHRGEIHSHPNPSPEENGSLADAQRESLNAEEMAAVRAHLKRCGVAAVVEPTRPGCWRVRYRLPEQPPLVSIIVPTRDKPALIRQCVESLRTKTTYPRYEILVVDNQSTNLESLAYLTALAGQETVRVLRYDYPFNYSAINNFAAREARGEVLCLLNNDTKIISEDWLEEMVGHLLQPKVGVVGAKLYFPDGRVQHAGDTVGPGGCANHLHAFIERDDPGYCNRAAVAQELSAVTAACLVTWKNIYQRMGGLEEKHLPVTFNDVDYCLRVREAGYRIVWTPHAELYHHEFESRGKDKSPEKAHRARREVAHMRKRWKHVMRHDPFYNPNLGYQRPDFLLSNAPMVERPWLT